MSFRAEVLLAATGVLRSKPVTRDDGAAAERQLMTMHRRLQAWTKRQDPKPEPFKPCAERDVDKLFDKLSTPEADADLAGMLTEFDDMDFGVEWRLQREAARKQLVDARPSYFIPTPTGPDFLPLSRDDSEEWLSLVDVVEDPMRIVDELEMYTLEPTQVVAFKAVYPELHSFCHAAISDALDQMAKTKKRMPWERESVLRVFLELPPETPSATATPGGPLPPPKEAPPTANVDIQSALKTPSQRLLTRA